MINHVTLHDVRAVPPRQIKGYFLVGLDEVHRELQGTEEASHEAEEKAHQRRPKPETSRQSNTPPDIPRRVQDGPQTTSDASQSPVSLLKLADDIASKMFQSKPEMH